MMVWRVYSFQWHATHVPAGVGAAAGAGRCAPRLAGARVCEFSVPQQPCRNAPCSACRGPYTNLRDSDSIRSMYIGYSSRGRGPENSAAACR
jgi:hypothetical protein